MRKQNGREKIQEWKEFFGYIKMNTEFLKMKRNAYGTLKRGNTVLIKMRRNA